MFAIHPNESATLLNDSVHRGQTQTCSLTKLLRCVERFKDAALRFFVHSTARVGNGQHDIVASRYKRTLWLMLLFQIAVRGFDREFSSLRLGITGVKHQ